MELWSRIFKEAKQVGVLYHFRAQYDIKTILEKGLRGNNERYLDMGQTKTIDIDPNKKLYSFSFTRNPKYKFFGNYGFKLDGDKLSNNYKFIPYSLNAWPKNKKTFEYEERIISNKEYIDIKPYILAVIFPSWESMPRNETKWGSGDYDKVVEFVQSKGFKIEYHKYIGEDDLFK